MNIIRFDTWLEQDITNRQLSELADHLTEAELGELIAEAIGDSINNPIGKKLKERAEDLFIDLIAAESPQVAYWDDDGYADYMYDKMKDDMLTGDW